jgi:long-chain acyl-CoA synthetase
MTDSTTDQANMITRLREAIARADGVAFRYPTGDGWTDVSYAELGRDVDRLAAGLAGLGMERGDVVAIFGDTRQEWVLADLAAIRAGLVVASIYHSSSAEEARHILDNSEAALVFCDNPETLAKVEQVRGDLPTLKHTVLFDGAQDDDTGALGLDDLRARGDGADTDELDRRAEQVSPDDLFTLVYTSGTTGPPKGCMITHRNVAAGLDNLEEIVDLGDDPLFYTFLPLAHVLTRLVELLAVDTGSTLGFWRQDMKAMLEDLSDLAPTHLAAVPRIFEKIYNKAYEQAGSVGGKLMDTAVRTGREVRRTERRGGRVGVVARVGHELADRVLFDRVRQILGGRVRLALVGAAPVATELLEFFDACGVLVLEGYGLTETSAAGAINRPDAFRFGTQGPPAPNTEVTLAERGDGDSDSDSDDDGSTDPGAEVLVRGPSVFAGYYKMPEETREAIDDDGWFHTGDVGSFDDDGFLTITGRTKDIIVTSSGKNIPAARIENEIAQSRWIEHAVLYGDNKNYLVVAVSLDADELSALAEQTGVEADQETMAASDAVRSEISDAIDAANENFARVEQVKEFAILPRSLSTDQGELTSTLKVKRKIVHDNHRDTFEALYPEN